MNEKLDFKLISELAYNKRPLLTREQAQPWLDALRSNKYPQTKMRLRNDRGRPRGQRNIPRVPAYISHRTHLPLPHSTQRRGLLLPRHRRRDRGIFR